MNIKEILLAKSKKGVVAGGTVAVVSAAFVIFVGLWLLVLIWDAASGSV